MESLSIVVLTKNEEQNLPYCLESVIGLGDIWIVDAGSTDHTVGIAEEAGAHVRFNPWLGFAAQRTWALERLPLREWAFFLDADERVDTELRENIKRFLGGANRFYCNGAFVARKFIFLDRWIKHGGMWPRYHLRLVRRDKAQVVPSEIDERLRVNGRIVRLRGAIIHEDRRGLKEWVLRHVRYAEFHPPEPRLYRIAPRVWRALLYWVWRYIFQHGWLDGKEGFIYHTLHTLFYRLLRDGLRLEEERRW